MPEDVHQYVCAAFAEFISNEPSDSKWEALRNDLLHWVQALPEDVAFNGLLRVLQREGRYQLQLLAGDLLHRGHIRCPMAAADLIAAVAPGLNESANTVAWYLEGSFGREAVVKALDDLRGVTDDPAVIAGIQSIRYHLTGHD